MSFFRTLLCAVPLVAACGGSHGGSNGGDGGVIDINGMTTGSITTPSLCERTQLDQRVSMANVDSFAFLWANDHYQLVYADATEGDIYSVRLSTTGQEQGSATIVEKTPAPSTLPTIISTSSGYLVAWQDAGATPAAHVHTLDSNGNPTGGSHPLTPTRSSQIRPVIASSPQGYAIAWMDQDPASVANMNEVGTSTTWLALLDGNYAVRTDVPAAHLDPANQSGYPWIVGDGNGLSLLYSDTVSGQTDVFFSPVSSSLGVQQEDVRGAGGKNAALLGRLLSTDFGYLATWEDHRSGEAEIYMSLLDTSHKVFFSGLVEEPMTGNANWSHQAWTGANLGVVYYQYRSGRPQIFLTFIDATGARVGGGADAQVSDTPKQAKYPDVQWNGTTFGVVWIDSRDGAQTLYFNALGCKKPSPI